MTDRQQAGVEPGLRRQAGQERIGHGLGHRDHAEHQAGGEVVGQVSALIGTQHRNERHALGPPAKAAGVRRAHRRPSPK